MLSKILRFSLYLILVSILITLFLGCIPSSSIIDGDTIKLTSGEFVRYLGIDTPEKGQPLFQEATAFNRSLLQGRSIILQSDKTDRDRYGRLLRYVFADTIFVNLEMVRQGLALAYSVNEFQDNMYYLLFEQASNEARSKMRGIWGLADVHPKLQQSAQDYYIPPAYLNMSNYMVILNAFGSGYANAAN